MHTKELRQHYVDDEGCECPICGSAGLGRSAPRYLPGIIRIDVICAACSTEWTDVYSLSAVDATDSQKAKSVEMWQEMNPEERLWRVIFYVHDRQWTRGHEDSYRTVRLVQAESLVAAEAFIEKNFDVARLVVTEEVPITSTVRQWVRDRRSQGCPAYVLNLKDPGGE